MKTLMMLGASGAQLNAIKTAMAMGYRVVATDYYEDSIGKQIAHEGAYASTFDAKACLDVATAYQVDGIMTTGTDQPVYTASIVAKNLGLPSFLDVDTAYKVTNKRAMKATFRAHHIPTVDYRIIGEDFEDHELMGLDFPVVVKPLDSQGQRGIYKLESIQEVREHFHKVIAYSREQEILVEGYYPNDEITISGWVKDGKPQILTVTDRVTFEDERHIGICTSHEFPSKHYKAYWEDFHGITAAIVDAFRIPEGPIYFQLFVGDKGVLVNEIACRIGGAYEDEFIPHITGVDLLRLVIEGSMGKPYDEAAIDGIEMNDNPHHLSVQLFFAKAGEICEMTEPSDVLGLEGVVNMGYNYRKGDAITSLENASQRAGYVIVEGSSREELISRVEGLYHTMKMIDKKGQNMIVNGEIYRK